MDSKQDRIVAIIGSMVGIAALIYMVKSRSAKAQASALAQASPTSNINAGFVPSPDSNPFAAAMGSYNGMAQGSGSGGASGGGSLTPFPVGSSGQSQHALFPYFGYAVGTGTTAALASVEAALINQAGSYNNLAYAAQTNKGGMIFGG